MRASEFVSEEWSAKYKRSINCSHPKGFSQRAHCQGRKKNEDLNEFSFGGDDDDTPKDDPYKYPKPEQYRRSIDFFGKFEANHFDKEDMDDATGVFKGYWYYGNKLRQIAYFKFNNPQRTGSNDPGMGWYYEPQDDDVAEGSLNEFAPGGNSASSYYAVTSNFVNEFAQQKQEEIQDLIDAGWTKQDIAQAGTQEAAASDMAHFEQVRDGFLKGLKPGFDAYLQGDTQLKDQLGAYWIDNDLPLNQDWEKIYGEPWGDDEQLDELTFKGSPCTKDCSGHRAGYEWSQRKGGVDAASWSRSFNNGAALFKNGF